MKIPKFNSIRSRFIFWFVLFTSLSIFIILFLVYNQRSQIIRSEYNNRLTGVHRQLILCLLASLSYQWKLRFTTCNWHIYDHCSYLLCKRCMYTIYLFKHLSMVFYNSIIVRILIPGIHLRISHHFHNDCLISAGNKLSICKCPSITCVISHLPCLYNINTALPIVRVFV